MRAICIALTAALTLPACERSREKNATSSVFKCLKVTQGHGRLCAGPGFMPPGAPGPADTFETSEAWCIVRRVSWADNRSGMACAPSEQECIRDIYIAPNGKPGLFNRTTCTHTSPAEWSPQLAPWNGTQDAFSCDKRAVVGLSEDAFACSATPAELLNSDSATTRTAWCYSTRPMSDEFLSCFMFHEDCENARKSETPEQATECQEQGPQRALQILEQMLPKSR